MKRRIISFALALFMLAAVVPLTSTPALAATSANPSFEVKHEMTVYDGTTLLFSEEPTKVLTGEQYWKKTAYVLPVGTKIAQRMDGTLTLLTVLGETPLRENKPHTVYASESYEVTLTTAMSSDKNGVRICGSGNGRGLLMVFIGDGPSEELIKLPEVYVTLPTQAQINSFFNQTFNPRVLEINKTLYNSMGSDRETLDFLTLPTADKIDYPEEWQEIADLATSLTKDCESDYDKLLSIYRWITKNITYDTAWASTTETRPQGDSALEVYAQGKGICNGLMALLNEMCRSVGIPMRDFGCTITGLWNDSSLDGIEKYIKDPTQWYDEIDNSGGHAFSAAYVNNRWVLMDVTWDLGNDVLYYFDISLENLSRSRVFWSVQERIQMIDVGYTKTDDGVVAVGFDGVSYHYVYDMMTVYSRRHDFMQPLSENLIEIKLTPEYAKPTVNFFTWQTQNHYIYNIKDSDWYAGWKSQYSAPNLGTAAEWARAGIQSAYSKGFVPVDLQDNYKNIITRQEFCRMAVKFVEYQTGKTIDAVLDEKGVSRNPNAFSDTTDPDILAAYALGITSGTKAPSGSTPGTFTPDGEFSREQAATMIMNTCKVVGMDVSNIPTSDFVDLNTASTWAVNGINFVRANGIMSGTSSNPTKPAFSPKGTYTRQESIVTFDRIK